MGDLMSTEHELLQPRDATRGLAAGGRAVARRIRRWLDDRGVVVSKRGAIDRLDHALQSVLAKYNVDGVLDVGANLGQYVRFLREDCHWLGPIWSFEPIRDNFAALCRVLGSDPQWKGLNVALGSRSATCVMNHCPTLSGLDSLLSPTSFGRRSLDALRTVRREAVSVRRLDAVVEGTAGIDVASSQYATEPVAGARLHLKLDTQGFDLEVLRGATRCLDRIVSLQIELSVKAIYKDVPPMLDAMDEVMKMGFAPVNLFPTVRDSQLQAIEFDGLFVRHV
jgi:FkbM family methyltransferase